MLRKVMIHLLENADDKFYCDNGHFKFFVKGHGNDAVFEFRCEQFQFAFQIFRCIEWQQGLQATQTNIANL